MFVFYFLYSSFFPDDNNNNNHREGIQFFTTGVGGLGYALYASWKVALVVLAVTPFISISAMAVVSLNQSKSSRAAKAYSKAGSVAYASVSGIKTVLSLNAAGRMIDKYKQATEEALKIATGVLLKQGFANGMSRKNNN
jgi:ATP-binding cassette subfamily B (MDR/TAP) protein 1